MRSLIASVMVLALASPAGAGSWGWGKGVVDSCSELLDLINADMSRLAHRDVQQAIAISDSPGQMYDWCVSNLGVCQRQSREVERRDCFVSPGTVTYYLDSRSGTWRIELHEHRSSVCPISADMAARAGFVRVGFLLSRP